MSADKTKTLAAAMEIDQKSDRTQKPLVFENQPLTIDELCTYLRAKKSTIYEYNRQGIPRFPVGKAWRYLPEKVIEWLEARGKRRLYPRETRFDPQSISIRRK